MMESGGIGLMMRQETSQRGVVGGPWLEKTVGAEGEELKPQAGLKPPRCRQVGGMLFCI